MKSIGQGGQDFEKFYGQVAANDGGNSYLDAATQAKAKLHSLVGKDAIDYSHVATQQLNDTYEHITDSMPTPEARLQFAQDTRRLHSSILGDIADYGAEQTRTYAINTNNQRITSGTGMAVMGDISGNQDNVDIAKEFVRNAYVKNAQLMYGMSDTGAANLAIQHADDYLSKERIKAAIPNNPKLAQKILAENQGTLSTDPDFDALNNGVNTAVANMEVIPAANARVASIMQDAKGVVSRGGMSSAPGAISETQAANVILQSFPGATITSGQRTPEHNAAVGGVPDSMHLSGQAVDFVPPKGTTKEQVAAALDKAGLPHTELIDEGTHIHWGWGGKGDAGQQTSAPSPQYASTTDAVRANFASNVEKATTDAAEKWPNNPEWQERYVSHVERGLNLAITQQEMQYDVDVHTVQRALSGPNAPISETEFDPQTKAAWDNVQANEPYKALGLKNMLDANAKGKAGTLGAQFYDSLDRATAPDGDPNRAKNVSDFWPVVGAGKDAALTNTGANQLSQLMEIRNEGPQGEAFVSQVRTFATNMHGNLSFTSKVSGVQDPKGEARFAGFMAQAIPIMTQAYKQGPQAVADILDPKSKDYLGNIAQHFARPPAERLRDLLSDEPRSGAERDTLKNVYGLPDNASKIKALQDAVSAQTISRADAERIGYTLGLIAPNGPAPPPVPKPQ